MILVKIFFFMYFLHIFHKFSTDFPIVCKIDAFKYQKSFFCCALTPTFIISFRYDCLTLALCKMRVFIFLSGLKKIEYSIKLVFC